MDELQEAVIYVQDFINSQIANIRGQKYGRLDNRNRLLVYCPSVCPKKFVDNVVKYGMTIDFPDESGVPILYKLVSEKEWSEMRFDAKHDTDPSFFDAAYYRPSLKNDFYSEYTWSFQYDILMEHAKSMIDWFHPSSFLDVGAAKGFLLKALLLQGVKEVRGIDISQWAIDHCEPEVKGWLQQFDLSTGNPLPFADNSFDIVNSDSTLEHLDSSVIPRVLRDFYRVSKKWVLVSFPLGLTDYSRPWGDPSHKSVYCPSWWISKAHDVGLLFDWRYSKFTAAKNNPEFVAEAAHMVFVKDKLDSDCPWDKLSIKVMPL